MRWNSWNRRVIVNFWFQRLARGNTQFRQIIYFRNNPQGIGFHQLSCARKRAQITRFEILLRNSSMLVATQSVVKTVQKLAQRNRGSRQT